MTQPLAGKTALVTGASSGIGQATALALAAQGVSVAVMGRRKARLDDLVTRIEAAGGTALALPGDVIDEAAANQAVADTAAAFGRIDILVNSAGVNDGGGLESLAIENWHKVVDINLWGTINCCRAAMPLMKAQGQGDVINISSTAGRRSAALFAAYATSKHALTGFTEAFRQEVGNAGIRVCIIEPGATRTEIADSITDPAMREMVRQHVSKDGVLEASDIADAVVFALSLPRRANVSTMLVRPTIDTAPM